MSYDIEQIARTCHEVCAAYAVSCGDHSYMPWECSKDYVRIAAREGVRFALDHPGVTPEALHEVWCMELWKKGWTYGPVKDTEKKTHPSLVAYDQLPTTQRLKDELFRAVVCSFMPPGGSGD